MVQRTDESGWVQQPECSLELDVGDQETRVGRICADETCVVDLAAGVGPALRPPSAEFHPPDGGRATGEVTNLWRTSRASWIQGLVACWGRARCLRVSRPVGLVVALVVLLGGAWGLGRVMSAEERDRAASFQPRADRPEAAPDPRNAAREETPRTDAGPGSSVARDAPRLGDAVEAVADGRLEQGLEIYRDLARSAPGDPATDLAVEILTRALEGGARR